MEVRGDHSRPSGCIIVCGRLHTSMEGPPTYNDTPEGRSVWCWLVVEHIRQPAPETLLCANDPSCKVKLYHMPTPRCCLATEGS